MDVDITVTETTADPAAIAKLNDILPEHDYVFPTFNEKLQSALQEIEQLQNVVESITEMRFSMHRYSANSDLLKIYTGYSSH